MTLGRSVDVIVPATTANLGPGFDCIGAALNLYNRFRFAHADDVVIRTTGQDVLTAGRDNLVYRAFARAFGLLSKPVPGVEITIDIQVPLSRGLGSSATAIIGGLLGANSLGGLNLSPKSLLEIAIAIEGHPDNVVPALCGGCQLSVSGQQWTVCPLDWHESLQVVAVVPNFKLSTETAREVLPEQVDRADAIFNVAHVGLLVRALATANGDWLRVALDDRLHQPYRSSLIPGFASVQAAALAAGAHGMVISGAGPTLLAFTTAHANNREAVGNAMVAAWRASDIEATAHYLDLDREGGRVVGVDEP